ncbi:hypothetical protein KQX54_012274 [Cotesia glomerata]|uniref:Uncharacterized protein n=1 Tax=Cotesia glomerata TaxID=32391 RepID=A0AAV7ILK3_COTGL|nr:hypothetical protein KQX54_012274 [Cotesia glomerata]
MRTLKGLSLSFSINNSNSEEINNVYELQLSGNESDVVKFVENGWNKLCAEDPDKATTKRGNYYIDCAKLQIVDTERQYTILVIYQTDFFLHSLKCAIIVMTSHTEPLTISCFRDFSLNVYDPKEEKELNMCYSFFDNKQFCPRDKSQFFGTPEVIFAVSYMIITFKKSGDFAERVIPFMNLLRDRYRHTEKSKL